MLIKQPTSDISSRKLWNFLEVMEERLQNCNNKDHDFLTITYMSTYVISPLVSYRGSLLLDKIRHLINLSPQRVVWILRTASPYSFPHNPRSKGSSIRNLQSRAIDSLRDRCYVVVYSRDQEFLNHAKFLIYYHVCFSEGVLYHGKYYGSTNLTNAGLSERSGQRPGNYEEFYVTRPKPRFLNFTDTDRFYLNEIYSLLLHEVRLYTDVEYLREFLSGHLRHFDRILQYAQRILSGTTLAELYDAYISAQIFFNQTLSLLDELPGKKLTAKLIEDIEREFKQPEYPLALEMAVLNDLNLNEKSLKEIGLNERMLRELLEETVKGMKEVRKKVAGYMDSLSSLSSYFDEKEEKFVEFIRKNSEVHIARVKKITMMANKGS